MGSRKATVVVLRFIAPTRVGQKAERMEQERETQERERDEAWDLDENRLEEDAEKSGEGGGKIEREEGKDEEGTKL